MIIQFLPDALNVQATKETILKTLDLDALGIESFDYALPETWITAAYERTPEPRGLIASCFVWAYFKDGTQGAFPICSRGVTILSKLSLAI